MGSNLGLAGMLAVFVGKLVGMDRILGIAVVVVVESLVVERLFEWARVIVVVLIRLLVALEVFVVGWEFVRLLMGSFLLELEYLELAKLRFLFLPAVRIGLFLLAVSLHFAVVPLFLYLFSLHFAFVLLYQVLPCVYMILMFLFLVTYLGLFFSRSLAAESLLASFLLRLIRLVLRTY